MLINRSKGDRIAIVDGVRTPFCKAGTVLKDVNAVSLARHSMRSLIDRLNLDVDAIDEVIIGCVGQPVDAQNIARAAALLAGVPERVPAVTVHRNCASGLESITMAAEKILSGQGEVFLVGGTESMSNYPLIYSKAFVEWFSDFAKTKTLGAKIAALSRFRPAMLTPQIGVILGLTDYACSLSMGTTAENLAVEFGISRLEQDEYALESHRRAAASSERVASEIEPITMAPYREFISQDNGPRKGQTIEALEKLKPYFDRRSGTVTVGNSCPISDGAGALLVTTERRAKAMGYQPKGYLRSYAYAGLAPERMGLGPVFATAKALCGMTLADMQLIEINEAFAAQVIACERAFDSAAFAKKELGRSTSIGVLDRARVNVNGGAIALGHPVGATGSRIVMTLLHEMERRGLGMGLATLCVGGGQGGALVLERE